MKLRLSKKKKDYRPFCRFFYTASPSECHLGFVKAGCKIATNGLPSKYCRRCKFGIAQHYVVDEREGKDNGKTV